MFDESQLKLWDAVKYYKRYKLQPRSSHSKMWWPLLKFFSILFLKKTPHIVNSRLGEPKF